MVIAWIVIGVGLVAFEMHHLAFFASFGAIGAFSAAGVAVVAPSAIPVQIAVAAVVAGVGVAAVRPHVSTAFARRGPGVSIAGVHGGLVGARGVTTDAVTDHSTGHVRLLGEIWLATTIDLHPIPPQTPVFVTAVNGTTLTVRAVDQHLELT